MLGGFHLAPYKDDYVREVVAGLKEIDPGYVVPMHCTGEPFYDMAQGGDARPRPARPDRDAVRLRRLRAATTAPADVQRAPARRSIDFVGAFSSAGRVRGRIV